MMPPIISFDPEYAKAFDVKNEPPNASDDSRISEVAKNVFFGFSTVVDPTMLHFTCNKRENFFWYFLTKILSYITGGRIRCAQENATSEAVRDALVNSAFVRTNAIVAQHTAPDPKTLWQLKIVTHILEKDFASDRNVQRLRRCVDKLSQLHVPPPVVVPPAPVPPAPVPPVPVPPVPVPPVPVPPVLPPAPVVGPKESSELLSAINEDIAEYMRDIITTQIPKSFAQFRDVHATLLRGIRDATLTDTVMRSFTGTTLEEVAKGVNDVTGMFNALSNMKDKEHLPQAVEKCLDAAYELSQKLTAATQATNEVSEFLHIAGPHILELTTKESTGGLYNPSCICWMNTLVQTIAHAPGKIYDDILILPEDRKRMQSELDKLIKKRDPLAAEKIKLRTTLGKLVELLRSGKRYKLLETFVEQFKLRRVLSDIYPFIVDSAAFWDQMDGEQVLRQLFTPEDPAAGLVSAVGASAPNNIVRTQSVQRLFDTEKVSRGSFSAEISFRTHVPAGTAATPVQELVRMALDYSPADESNCRWSIPGEKEPITPKGLALYIEKLQRENDLPIYHNILNELNHFRHETEGRNPNIQAMKKSFTNLNAYLKQQFPGIKYDISRGRTEFVGALPEYLNLYFVRDSDTTHGPKEKVDFGNGRITIGGDTYQLQHMIVHTGSATGGHYFCYSWTDDGSATGKWTEYNDSRVTENVDLNPYTMDTIQGNTTMAIYKRVDRKSV